MASLEGRENKMLRNEDGQVPLASSIIKCSVECTELVVGDDWCECLRKRNIQIYEPQLLEDPLFLARDTLQIGILPSVILENSSRRFGFCHDIAQSAGLKKFNYFDPAIRIALLFVDKHECMKEFDWVTIVMGRPIHNRKNEPSFPTVFRENRPVGYPPRFCLYPAGQYSPLARGEGGVVYGC